MSKVTIEIDEELLHRVRDEEARTGRPASEIVATAIRRYVGPGILDQLWERNDLDEDAAIRLAVEEIDALRAERSGG